MKDLVAYRRDRVQDRIGATETTNICNEYKD